MLNVEHLSFSYHRHMVLSDISFQAVPTDIVGIIGQNGCGKSTLLSLLAGVLKPDSGSVFFQEKRLSLGQKGLSELIGYVPQTNPLLPELSVKDNLKLWQLSSQSSVLNGREALFSSLLLMDIMKTPVKKLSEGMKKRVSIASAMQNEPKILILDEPTAALDLPCKEVIHSALMDFAKGGGIILITTHEEADFQLCSKLFVLKNGFLSSTDSSKTKQQLIQLM